MIKKFNNYKFLEASNIKWYAEKVMIKNCLSLINDLLNIG